jgi:hypothetical protein
MIRPVLQRLNPWGPLFFGLGFIAPLIATLVTRMYGPAVRCKKISSNWRRRSCINVSGL